MSDYARVNDFTAKDSLPSGNPLKVIKGSNIDAEFDAIVSAIASKVDETNGTASGLTLSGATSIGGTLTVSAASTITGNVTFNTGTMSGTGIIDGGTY